MDKRGQFFDTDVLAGAGFWILFGLAAGATVLGYILSKKWSEFSFPLWQVIIIIIAEFFGAYFFASRG